MLQKKVAVETADQAGELNRLDREHASRNRALETAGLANERIGSSTGPVLQTVDQANERRKLNKLGF